MAGGREGLCLHLEASGFNEGIVQSVARRDLAGPSHGAKEGGSMGRTANGQGVSESRKQITFVCCQGRI